MIWSFSDHRIFRSCQRKWYYDAVVAYHNAKKEPIRREAFLLSKLQGLPSWRGQLIDYVITEHLIKGRMGTKFPSLDSTLTYASDLFNRQVEFGRAHRLREPGLKVSEHQGEFVAWYPVEYGEGVSDAELKTIWAEVQSALTNLFDMAEIFTILANARWLISQRSLTFTVDDVTVRATPDLIVFRRNQPPLIIDWKTYISDNRDHRMQLACYALALTSCKPHRDFPTSLSQFTVSDIDLMEVQLITKKQRWYKLSADDSAAVEDFILQSALEMQMAVAGLPRTVIDPEKMAAAFSPITCRFCAFRSLCWEG